MSLSAELLKILDNGDEPLPKRIKVADNAFKSPELPLQHREAFLLHWILRNARQNDHDVWRVISQWLNSEQFKELSRNEISNDEIKIIIDLILERLTSQKNAHITSIIADTFANVIENKIFQQYFTNNLGIFCKLISSLLENITCPAYFIKFIKARRLFLKNVSIEESYPKHFLEIVMPTLMKVIIKFKNDQLVFEEVSKIVQRNIFYGNVKKFELFLNQYFEEKESIKHGVTKYLLKHLLSPDLEFKETYFKVIFHSFCQAYNDFGLVYKWFVILVQILGFDLSETLIIHKSSKLKCETNISTSLKVLLGLFEVLSENNNLLDYSINETSFTNFLKNVLKSLMFLNIPNATVYDIFLKTIAINPLIIESIINQVVVFIMLANNEDQMNEYENLIVAVFEVFARLHRIENFVSKLIPSLQKSLEGEFSFEEVYNFTGIKDLEQKSSNIVVSNIFTNKVLQYFTHCIYNLASWQVINLFKTFLYHLQTLVKNFEELSHNKVIFLEILSLLTCWLLQSVRMAEHTVASNVVEKFIKGLEDLRGILKKYGSTMLHRKHNCAIMRSFLNIAFHWGEVFITVSYYNNEVDMHKTTDSKNAACNLRYIHSYLSVEQWCSISERINNFGEAHCKILLQKLYVQKLRAMLIFEDIVNEDVSVNVITSISSNIEETWQDILLDKYIINNLLIKMDSTTVLALAEKFLLQECLVKQDHLLNSVLFVNAVNYVILNRLNKLFKRKRKQSDNFVKKPLSSRIFSLANEELFLKDGIDDSEIISKAKEILYEENEHLHLELNEERLLINLRKLRSIPIIFSKDAVLKFVLIYLFALHKDIGNNSSEVKKECETLIIGILQNAKLDVVDIYNDTRIMAEIINSFLKYDEVFLLMIDNIFKHEESIKKFDNSVSCLLENLSNCKYLECSLVFLNIVNKIKKSKFSSEIKNLAATYKDNVLCKIEKIISKKEPHENFVEAYGICLRQHLTNKDVEESNKLFGKLAAYLDFSLNNISNKHLKGYLLLFSVVLNNKQKLKSIENDVILKVWNSLKKVEVNDSCFEDFSRLVSLVFTITSSEDFLALTTDMLSFTEAALNSNNHELLLKQLQIWESVMACNVNPVKTKIWQEILENVLLLLLDLVENSVFDENLFKNIVRLQETIIQAHNFVLTPPLLDIFLIIPTVLSAKEDFFIAYNLSISLLEKLLKWRNAFVMDRLPVFLQQYRLLLKNLCKKSNSDLNLEISELNLLADCSHKLEKLTNNLVSCKKDMGRISMYLIADILAQYERVTLYRNVKIHLDNCVYSLISLCDNHAVAYLMRVLSSASTEMFKMLYENYKKYYMFTGKV